MNRLTHLSCVGMLAGITIVPASAWADAVFNGRGLTVQGVAGGAGARSTATLVADNGAAAGRRGIASDGQGNTAGRSASGFSTAGGGQGLRSRQFTRSADGGIDASGQANASGSHGSAERSSSFTRNADGSASGQRSTSVTNANTGVTLDGSTTYSKGSGISRSASCKDASGNTVSCGSR